MAEIRSKPLKLYLAGPMTGIEKFNKPAFFRAAAELRIMGFEVINPAEHDDADGKDWTDYMRKDMRLLSQVDGVAVLPKWNRSKGARLEVYIALTLGMPIFDAETGETYNLKVDCDPIFNLSGLREGA